jgi:predicted dehydrogenase
LMVGFNRRFSPLMAALAAVYADTDAPLVMHYRVHAGQLESGSWYLDPAEGNRFLGESGHFFDVFSFLARSAPVSVSATCLRPECATADDVENMAVTVQYENGSIGNLLYLTQGDTTVPKECLEVFGAGRTARLDNFTVLEVYRDNRVKRTKSGRIDKGQANEIERFLASVKQGVEMPIPLTQLLDATRCSLAAMAALRIDSTVRLNDYVPRL